MKVEVLMSAMHQTDFSIAVRSRVQSDLLLINQCDQDDYQEITVDGRLWRMISTTERGLSKSRNMALEHAKGDICLLADDDETLAEGYVEILAGAYERLPNAGAIVFNIDRIHNNLKKKYYRILKIRRAPFYRGYGSPMLSVKLQPVHKYGIRFNEQFGSGTPWGGGEDVLFEDDIRKHRIPTYEYPATIATIDYSGGSNWFHGYTEQYFYNSGAFSQHRYKCPVLRWAQRLYTCWKLRRDKNLSPREKLKWMALGGRGIKNNVTYSEFLANRNENPG